MDTRTLLLSRRAFQDRMSARRALIENAWSSRRRVLGVPVGTIGKMALGAGALVSWRRWLPLIVASLGRPYLETLLGGAESRPSAGSSVLRKILGFLNRSK